MRHRQEGRMPQRAPGSREEDAWLSDAQLTKCTPADEAEGFDSPIPTQMVSNGEYMPYPQTDKQRQVEARIKELADSASKKLGISRRKFLAGTGGMAAALLAMNEVFGRFFDVRPIDMFESEAFAASGPPQNLFVLDDQTHMVRFTQTQGRSLRAIAQGPGPASTAARFLVNPNNPTGLLDELGNAWTPWNPLLGQTPNTGSEFHLAKYIQRFFLESQVTVSILSNANLGSIPVAGEPNRPPKNIAESLGAENLTGHMTAGVRDFVNQIAGSTRMLAHGQLYPGIRNGCFALDSLETIRSGSTRVVQGAEVPDISWTTQFAELSAPFRNVYAERGTTFAGSVVTFPTVWAHIIGQLLKFMGPDRIVFGSDSLWYGGPQWQIDAFWRFQIPEEIQERWGYPALTEASRRKILGLNPAGLD